MGTEFSLPRISRRSLFKGAAGLGGALLFGPKILHADGGDKELEPRTLESTFLMYHQMSAAGLKRDLLNYINRGFEPIGLERLVDHLNGNVMIPPDQPTFMVTCDDGLASQYPAVTEAVYEVLNETGYFVPVIFFVMTKFNDLPLPMKDIPGDTPLYNDHVNWYMTKDEIIKLIQMGFRPEAHTPNHGYLPDLKEDDQRAEIVDGEKHIRDIYELAGVKKKYSALAYPRGGYNYQIVDLVSQIYDVAFSTNPTTFHSSSARYILGRIGR